MGCIAITGLRVDGDGVTCCKNEKPQIQMSASAMRCDDVEAQVLRAS